MDKREEEYLKNRLSMQNRRVAQYESLLRVLAGARHQNHRPLLFSLLNRFGFFKRNANARSFDFSIPSPFSPGSCNICGSRTFRPGPGGRLSKGRKPSCTVCGSLERHRIIKNVWDVIRSLYPITSYRCLQFAEDISVVPVWFKEFVHSEYGFHNSFDLQKINLPDASFDVIICNHVLEHVADDTQAVRELLRVVAPGGLVQMTVPSPHPVSNPLTRDWGFPDETQHGHYRIYGADIVNLFQKAIPGKYLLTVIERDEVTDAEAMVFLLAHDAHLGRLSKRFVKTFFQKL